MTIEGLREQAIKLLREDYQHAKQAVIELEVFTNSKSKKAVYELRDFLDHLATIFLEDEDAERVRPHLDECRTHLRRCIVEPIEYLAEKQFVQAERYYRWWVYHIPVIGDSEAYSKLLTAKKKIVQGRLEKTSVKAYDTFKEAFEITTDLLARAHPGRIALGVIAYTVPIVGVTIALVRFFSGK